jgi:predicted naringenin-chalcone synthase
MDEMFQQANNKFCFGCDVELNEVNTSMWQVVKQLENTDIKAVVSQCVVCAEVASRMLVDAVKDDDTLKSIRIRSEVYSEVLDEFSVEELKNRELQSLIKTNKLSLVK